ncbi:MAG: cold shock domain-containing protein [Anaerolineae bacterium]|nr:cold shock domain-containing protein [Anaerolineae bacterium]
MNAQAAQLLADKLVKELFRIAQAYGQEHANRFEDLAHDLAVMLEWDGLNTVSLKFYQPNGNRDVLVEYNYAMHCGRNAAPPRFYLDDAQGLSIAPISPPFEMGLVINRDSRNGAYEQRLRLRWGNAPDYRHRDGFEHQDGNTAKRTGGRASKQVYMDSGLRRRGQIKFYLPDRQYGFIDGNATGADIFFHAHDVRGFDPLKGLWVTYLPLATPRGVQAKDVQRAS